MTKKVEKAEIETSGLGTACVDVARRGFVRSGASLLLKGTQSCAGKNKAMKKLMFAAAVAACATVGLATETGIVSANIVGYAGNQCDTDFGTSLMAPQFVNVSTTSSIQLKDIKPVANTEYEISYGDVDVQFLDNGGYTIEDKWYVWNGSNWEYYAGTKMGQDASAEVIPVGAGVSVACGVDPSDAVITLQSAGQVGEDDALVELDQDFGTVLAGNPFPVDTTVGKLTLELNQGSEYELSYGDVDVQFVDNGGYTIEDKWYVWNGTSWEFYAGTKMGQDASLESIPAGTGISVACGVDPSDAVVTIRVPAPEL